MATYESEIAELVTDADLMPNELIKELGEFVDEVERNAYDYGKNEAVEDFDTVAMADLEDAKAEWREIVESFKRSDIADVRSRLMDLGSRVFNVDVWIPSR